jgi:hypothetical protein
MKSMLVSCLIQGPDVFSLPRLISDDCVRLFQPEFDSTAGVVRFLQESRDIDGLKTREETDCANCYFDGTFTFISNSNS